MGGHMTNVVFVVWHTHSIGEPSGDPVDDDKLLGIFTSRARADARIDQARDVPGFREVPDGFTIDEYVLDEPYWADGFQTAHDGDHGRSGQVQGGGMAMEHWSVSGFDRATGELRDEHKLPASVSESFLAEFVGEHPDLRVREFPIPPRIIPVFAEEFELSLNDGLTYFIGLCQGA